MTLINLKPTGIGKRARSLIAFALFISIIPTALASDEDPSRIWIERPWEYRYIVYIESPDNYEVRKKNAMEDVSAKKINHFRLEPLFPLAVSITTDPDYYRGADKAIGLIIVQFDRDGHVTTPNELSLNLRGRMNRIFGIVLSAGDKHDSWKFYFGDWYTGRDGAALAYTPAICTTFDMDRRYVKGFKASSVSTEGNFGCREWGYYLQNDEIPYIDVTSYGKDEFGPFSYVRPVLGWARFDTPPKPVIGKHGNVWVCLHECPNGDTPGIITDIKQWAAKNGWPVPKQPKKQPMFLDREYKRGEFPD